MFSEDERKKLCDKNSFLINKTLFEDIKEMNDGEVKYLMYAIFEYVIDGVIPDLIESHQRFVRVAFNRFKRDYEIDSRKWLDTCDKRSLAGKRSAESRKEKKDNSASVNKS